MIADSITFYSEKIGDDSFAFKNLGENLRLLVEPDGAAEDIANMVRDAVGGAYVIERVDGFAGVDVFLTSKMRLAHALDAAISQRLLDYAFLCDTRLTLNLPNGFDLDSQICRMRALRSSLDLDGIMAEMTERAGLLREFLSEENEDPVGTVTTARLPVTSSMSGSEKWGLRDEADRWLQYDGRTVQYESERDAVNALHDVRDRRITFTEAPHEEHPVLSAARYGRKKPSHGNPSYP